MIPKHYHFSGICGTAMASLAVLLKTRGHRVTGSDENVYPPMSDLLADNDIEITSPYQKENLIPHPDVVVLGNALSRGNEEVEYALEAHLNYISMAELLKTDFIRGNTSVVAAGTHGKTTTTSLASHVLHDCGKPTGFMIGGVAENFGKSSQDVKKGGYFVVEGDEYDTCFFDKRSKFFHYLPDRLILNNIEFDHADIFNNLDEIKRSFSLMLRQIPRNGLIIANGDDDNVKDVLTSAFTPFILFGKSSECDAKISKVSPLKGKIGMGFQLDYKGKRYPIEIPLMGEFNVYNASAVTLLALEEGIPFEKVQAALGRFKNVMRRLQLLTQKDAIKVYDDFAHHPTAITETVKAVRNAHPEATLHAIYEARSNTSVRKFHQERMAGAFQDADTITFYKLHRGEKIVAEDRLDLTAVVNELNQSQKKAWQFDTLDQIFENTLEEVKKGDIVLVMSQGAFGGIQHRIAKAVDEQC